MALGALAYAIVRVYSEALWVHDRDHYDTIVISTKANPTGTTTAPTARRSTCIFEQMPVSELAVMVQGRRQFQSAWRA